MTTNNSVNSAHTSVPTGNMYSLWDANNNLSANSFIDGYATTATAAGTTTLTVSSAQQQFFTGSTTQTVVLPVTSTLVLGQTFLIVNNSTGVVTVQSSGANTITAMAASTVAVFTCILTSGTTAVSWNSDYETAGVTYPITLAQGGTNANLTASNGGIFYSTASAGAILAGTATASQVLLSGASTTPTWSTATYPATTTVNQLLYSSATNVIGGLATANSAMLATTSAGVPTFIGSATNGQLLIGSTTATPVLATITAGPGITVTNAAGSITIASQGAGESWTVVTGTSATMVAENGYISNNAGLVTLTMPATMAVGQTIDVAGLGAGGWQVNVVSGQTIHVGNTACTASTGNIASTNQWDSISILCLVANTTFSVLGGPQGNITVA